jgi:hypothetical protein
MLGDLEGVNVAESSTAIAPASQLREALTDLTPELRIVGRNLSKADILRYDVDGRRVAVKDYGARPFLARQTIGRLLVRRECRAYQRAGAVPGLAPFLGRLGPFTLATAWIDAVPLADHPRESVTSETFDRLDALIAGLHARGVALSDLHHRDVLVAGDGSVHVVDLAVAHVLGPRPGALRRRVFARLSAQDLLAAARMRARFTGGSEAEALAGIDPAARRLWGAGRAVKSFWDRLRGKRA